MLKTPVAMIKTLELVLIGEERYRCYCDGAIISDTMCVLNPVHVDPSHFIVKF